MDGTQKPRNSDTEGVDGVERPGHVETPMSVEAPVHGDEPLPTADELGRRVRHRRRHGKRIASSPRTLRQQWVELSGDQGASSAPRRAECRAAHDTASSPTPEEWLPLRLPFVPRFLLLPVYKALSVLFRTSYTLTHVMVLWVIPLVVLWTCAVVLSVVLSTFSYVIIYHSIAPAAQIFPVYFNYNPTRLLLQEPFVAFTPPPSIPSAPPNPGGHVPPLATEIWRRWKKQAAPAPHILAGPAPRLAPFGMFTFAAAETPYEQQTQQQPYMDEGQTFHMPKEKKEENNDRTEAVAHKPKKDHRRDNDPRYVGTATAVAFVTFNNRTWERSGRHGVSELERCLYYHYLKEERRHEEAEYALLQGGDATLSRPRRRTYRRRPPAAGGRDFATVLIDLKYSYNVALRMEYTPYQWSAPIAAADEQETRHALPSALTTMVSLELFDRNCTRIARSSRPHVVVPDPPTRRPQGFLAALVSRWRRGHRQTTTQAVVPLVEKWRAESQWDTNFARLTVSPPVPVVSAQLVLEPQLEGLRYVIRQFPWASGVLFVGIASATGGTLLTVLFMSLYAGGLRTVFRDQDDFHHHRHRSSSDDDDLGPLRGQWRGRPSSAFYSKDDEPDRHSPRSFTWSSSSRQGSEACAARSSKMRAGGAELERLLPPPRDDDNARPSVHTGLPQWDT